MLLRHWRDIVQPVKIRDGLEIGLVLDQLLGAAMQQADMRIGTLDHLAIHLQNQPQHAMRRRMLRSEIQGQGLDLHLCHQSAPDSSPATALSSPGNSDCAPSQGLRKSKVRKSWVSVTGS